jgi:hypothetical protein
VACFCADFCGGFDIAACAVLVVKVEAISAVAAVITSADDCLLLLPRDG